MKKILILYPHFPPSNLAGVHRPRLFAQHLPEFGWEPTVLTVHETFYEESPDWNLHKMLPENLRIEKVSAWKVTRPRLIGDIGLRAFFQLYKRAMKLIKNESFDFLYISIPSFYCALLGRMLHRSTGIPYGIDYIDPWVHVFPGSEKRFSRHWFTTQLAKMLEPLAIKNASLITGVAEGYYQDVLKRNPHLNRQAVTGAMPYGGDKSDHTAISSFAIEPYLFTAKPGKLHFVYAGAMLPKAYQPLESVFKAMEASPATFAQIEFHFIGTGRTPDDPTGFTIKPLAQKYNLWQTKVFEYPKRIPYVDVLMHLNVADAVFILGSTEPHYTPSKTYQGVLSGKPLLAVLHEQSSAVDIIRNSGAGIVLSFAGEQDLHTLQENFIRAVEEFRSFQSDFHPAKVDHAIFDQYSAKSSTATLATLLNAALEKQKTK